MQLRITLFAIGNATDLYIDTKTLPDKLAMHWIELGVYDVRNDAVKLWCECRLFTSDACHRTMKVNVSWLSEYLSTMYPLP